MDTKIDFSLNGIEPKIRYLLGQHGTEVFGTEENFFRWLKKENFFFDKKAPIEFMNTNSGIKFIDDRLTALEYGDNV